MLVAVFATVNRTDDDSLVVLTKTDLITQSDYAPHRSFAMPLHTNYTPELLHYALWALREMYKPGYRYMKCGVMLTDVLPEGKETLGLFGRRDTAKQSKLMA